MSFAGFRKQLNKANQYVSEKVGGAQATKLADDFHEMERKTDVTNELVEDIILKTKEYLQPNPASRAKLMAATKISKKNQPYPQPEGTLGEAMTKFGKQLGDDSLFGQALVEGGETLRQLADVKYALEDSVKQNFLEPLHHLQNKDLKDVMHHRKKMQGRRLDYDCKKRKQGKGAHITEDEIKLAEDKFEESLQLAQMGMFHLLENDVEQISQMAALAEALYEYHKQSAEIAHAMAEKLIELKEEATNRPRREYIPKKLTELVIPIIQDEMGEDGDYNGAPPPYSSTLPGMFGF